MIKEVNFWRGAEPGVFAETLSRAMSGVVVISDINENVILESEEHARALIKALESAIEQGWFPE